MNRIRIVGLVTLGVVLLFHSAARAEKQLANEKAMEAIDKAVEAWKNVQSMSAVFIRQERLEGETELGDKQIIEFRERTAPRAVYMKWIEGPGKNREASYFEKDKGVFRITPGGVLRGIELDKKVDDAEVFKVSRHTIPEAGIGQMMRKIQHQFEISKGDAMVIHRGTAQVDGRDCDVYWRFLPQKNDYYCWKLEMYVDKEWGFPVRVTCYDWQKKVFEDYTYTKLEFNGPNGDELYTLQKVNGGEQTEAKRNGNQDKME